MKKRSASFVCLLLLGISCTAIADEPASAPKRIVSLAPSMTEILFALGLGDAIVGVTSFCDYPEEAKKKPKVGGMSNPSLEAVVSLKPDIVVMTTDGNPQEFEERLRALGIRTYVFTARRISELPGGIRQLGKALGVSAKADEIARDIERRTRKTSDVNRETTPRKVLFIVWPEPLIVAGPGTAIDDAISLFGDRNIAHEAKSVYPKYSIEEVIRQAPDVIIIGKGSGMDMHSVARGILNRIESTPAVKSGRICYVGDGLYRLGPRVVDGIEEVGQCLE